jgi:ornithine cyclodeaminase/alanine dehydrogenase-like protein (mu-crystallin family)
MVMALSAETAHPPPMLFDESYLTDIRTTAADTVAARQPAVPNATVATLRGTGTRAELHARALALVRLLRKIRI